MANEKHIFIGLGGSGCQTVSQIKEKVYEKRYPESEATANKTRLQAMNDTYRFLFMDTDSRDVEEANKRNREHFEHGKVPFINPQTDLIALGRANPQAIYYEAKQDPSTLINKRILEACSPELAVKIPDQPLAFGAGAFRMKSRFAFAHSLADFQSKLQAAISSLNDVKTVGGQDCVIYYWVVGSSVGGTSSGIINDVLYHINQIHQQVLGNGDPQLVLTMYMPKFYIDANSTEEKYSLNAFGVFSEISAFKEMSYNANQMTVMHRMAFQNDYNLIDSNKRYCPFYYLIPIDIQTDKGTSLGTTRTMYRNTAELLYHLHNGQGGATFRSDIDNYMNDIMERCHTDFLVPMGYVSLQKPIEQFDKYMKSRFKRDILRSWLLCDDKTAVIDDDEKVVKLANELVGKALDSIVPTSVQQVIDEVSDEIETAKNKTKSSQELHSGVKFDTIDATIQSIEEIFKSEAIGEKKDEAKKIVLEKIWGKVEDWTRQYGLTFTLNAVTKVLDFLNEKFEADKKELDSKKQELDEKNAKLAELSSAAEEITTGEKISKGNKKDITTYLTSLEDYVTEFVTYCKDVWIQAIKKDLCEDKKNGELAKLKKHIASFQEKAAEKTKDAVRSYERLASDFGATALDVTTVYLPKLSTICDGNGWIVDNIFSKFYTTQISALSDKAETPDRKEINEFLRFNIYETTNEDTKKAINKGQYVVNVTNPDRTKKDKVEEIRFFANPNLDKSNEKVIDDFWDLALTAFMKKVGESKEIQEKWENKKISAFFADLENDEKDNVRRSLNPALFFSYNSNRIEITTKEEHVVFVAGSEDLAREMLGFEKGNPKHRFEKDSNENTALVLKSKFGLALSDYRIYDSIKAVYDRATFREKYHFHHDFSQFLNKITINDLPDEILMQHRTFTKLLVMEKFNDLIKPWFFEDEYDKDNYVTSMYLPNPENPNTFRIARPEAFGMMKGKIVLKKEENGRSLFDSISGENFSDQFKLYSELYFNHRYGETLDKIIQTMLRASVQLDEKYMTGDMLMENNYSTVRAKLLEELNEKRKSSPLPEEKRLYSIFFKILREDYTTDKKFINNK